MIFLISLASLVEKPLRLLEGERSSRPKIREKRERELFIKNIVLGYVLIFITNRY